MSMMKMVSNEEQVEELSVYLKAKKNVGRGP